MTKEREYRAYAEACVDLANKATNDEDKKHLLAMAEAWLGLADRVQRPLPKPDAFVASGASGKVAVSDEVRGTARLSDYPPALTRWPATPRARCPPSIPWLLAPSGRNAD